VIPLDCIENREAIASEIEDIIGPAAKLWGVKIESILIKDLSFSKELQESLSSAAQAKRIGESKVIAAKAEVDSAKLMREAADILNTQSAMQIRYLETLNGMAKTPHTKIVFLPSSGNNQQVDASQSVIYDLMSQRT
jgi:erythrocyte band 7 integral membrane protein